MKFRTLALFVLPGTLICMSVFICFVDLALILQFVNDRPLYIFLHAVLFAATLVLVGFGLCRGMTKYEVAAAASIYVAVQLIFHLALEAVSPHGFGFGIIYYFGFAYNQCFIDLVSEISGDASMSFLGVFSTYLFVLFGKDQEEQSE